jgi:hypothetical protein
VERSVEEGRKGRKGGVPEAGDSSPHEPQGRRNMPREARRGRPRAEPGVGPERLCQTLNGRSPQVRIGNRI